MRRALCKKLGVPLSSTELAWLVNVWTCLASKVKHIYSKMRQHSSTSSAAVWCILTLWAVHMDTMRMPEDAWPMNSTHRATFPHCIIFNNGTRISISAFLRLVFGSHTPGRSICCGSDVSATLFGRQWFLHTVSVDYVWFCIHVYAHMHRCWHGYPPRLVRKQT